MTTNQKMVAGMLAGVIAGLFVNKAVDNKLAASSNPGRLNKFARKNLKQGRTWGLALDAIIMAGMLICDEERAQDQIMKASFKQDQIDDNAWEDKQRADATHCTCTEYQATECGPWIDKCWFCQAEGMKADALAQEEMDAQSAAEDAYDAEQSEECRQEQLWAEAMHDYQDMSKHALRTSKQDPITGDWDDVIPAGELAIGRNPNQYANQVVACLKNGQVMYVSLNGDGDMDDDVIGIL